MVYLMSNDFSFNQLFDFCTVFNYFYIGYLGLSSFKSRFHPSDSI